MTAKPAEFEVWPENIEPLNVLMVLGTQWRINDGRVQGLDYQATAAVMDMMDVADKKQTFSDLRLMERAILDELK